MLTIVIVTTATYALALTGQLVLRRRGQGGALWVTVLLVMAWFGHFAAIGTGCVAGHHPFSSVFDAVSVGSWVAVMLYLGLASRARPLFELGAAVSAMAGAALLTSALIHPTDVSQGEFSTSLVTAHVALSVLGLAGLGLATGVASLYLTLDRRLRHKVVPEGMPGLSLRGLDRLHAIMVLIVTPVFAVAMFIGALALTRSGGWAMLGNRGIELAAGSAAFLACAASLVARSIWGFRGRRSAWVTMFAFSLVALILVSYGVRSCVYLP